MKMRGWLRERGADGSPIEGGFDIAVELEVPEDGVIEGGEELEVELLGHRDSKEPVVLVRKSYSCFDIPSLPALPTVGVRGADVLDPRVPGELPVKTRIKIKVQG